MGFIEPNLNDAKTMQKEGVWADHIQVQKAVHFLNRCIWLIRYDDVDISMDPDGRIIPGNSNTNHYSKLNPLL